jgi:hypothetical protein
MSAREAIIAYTVDARYDVAEPWITIRVAPTYLEAVEIMSDLDGARDFLGRTPLSTRVVVVPRRAA